MKSVVRLVPEQNTFGKLCSEQRNPVQSDGNSLQRPYLRISAPVASNPAFAPKCVCTARRPGVPASPHRPDTATPFPFGVMPIWRQPPGRSFVTVGNLLLFCLGDICTRRFGGGTPRPPPPLRRSVSLGGDRGCPTGDYVGKLILPGRSKQAKICLLHLAHSGQPPGGGLATRPPFLIPHYCTTAATPLQGEFAYTYGS
jgi:hypothetical protein